MWLSKVLRIDSKLFANQIRFVANEPKTHFGFETVRESEKAEKVYKVFSDVSDSYDRMNDAMSLGIHRVWKDVFVDRLGPTDGTQLLDVAAGTGDISLRYLKYLRNLKATGTVTICDINEAMLDAGKSRFAAQLTPVENENVKWTVADAEQLPFENESFDAYTIAFGIRNCTRIDRVLAEAYRVLRPGGRFMCLEFSTVHNPMLKRVYDEYSFQVIPVMGQLIAGQWDAYQYLVESIRRFPDQEKFAKMIETANFQAVTYEDLTFGIVAIHSGFKFL